MSSFPVPGRLYLKLYFSFLIIFILTIVIVGLISARFYANHVRVEMEQFLVTQARFLQEEYVVSCAQNDFAHPPCRRFLLRLSNLHHIHFWLVDRSGAVLYPKRGGNSPASKRELTQATATQQVVYNLRRPSPRVVVPLKENESGVHRFLVFERRFPLHEGPRRFPLVFTLAFAGLVIALLVLPVSLRLTRNLRKLHTMGVEWAEGHLEKRAEVSGNDEIAELARVFNTMAGNLQKIIAQRKEFLALISHELKTPLARMRIALEMIADRGGTEELINEIRSDVAESESLIEQLLLVSKMEMALDLDMEDLDVFKILERVVAQTSSLRNEEGIRVELETMNAGSSYIVCGNAQYLQRAFANIVENAVKYSPRGGVVKIAVHVRQDAVETRISDTGPGISNHEKELIFRAFYRATGAAEKEGAGLGLFIAGRIIAAHRGSISVEDHVSGGTVIIVELPQAG